LARVAVKVFPPAESLAAVKVALGEVVGALKLDAAKSSE